MRQSKFIRWLKFWLGMTVVVQWSDRGWVITKREFLECRACLDTRYPDSWWWTDEYWPTYCIFPTKEAAEAHLARARAKLAADKQQAAKDGHFYV